MGANPRKHTPKFDFNRVTTIRKSGSSGITTVPVEIMKLLNLSMGDKIEYRVDKDLQKVTIEKYKSEEQT